MKRKAAAGVRVLLLVWDELMSVSSRPLNRLVRVTRTGLLRTHDQETKEFFAGSQGVFYTPHPPIPKSLPRATHLGPTLLGI